MRECLSGHLCNKAVEKNRNKITFFKGQINGGINVNQYKKDVKELEDLNRRLSVQYQLNLSDEGIKEDEQQLEKLENNEKPSRQTAEQRQVVEQSVTDLTQYKQKLIRDEVNRYNRTLQKGKSQLDGDARESSETARESLLLRLPSFQHAHRLSQQKRFKDTEQNINNFESQIAAHTEAIKKNKEDLDNLRPKITYGSLGNPLEISATTPGKKELLGEIERKKKDLADYEKQRDASVNYLVSEYEHALRELKKETRGLGKLPPNFKALTMRLKFERDELLGKLAKPPIRIRLARIWADLFKSR